MTSVYWQCTKCGALHVKDAMRRRTAEKYIETGSPVLGHESCETCSARYEAEDVYRGRRDPPQSDAFVAGVIANPKSSHWHPTLRIWTRTGTIEQDDVVVLELDPGTVAHYRESASPLQLAAVALAKTSEEPHDLHADGDGLVIPGARIKTDFPSWRVWLSTRGDLWVTKKKVTWEDYSDATIPDALKRANYAGPVPAVPYLVGLCMAAGMDPNKLSPLEIRRLDEAAARAR
jgi:hypothetical protein